MSFGGISRLFYGQNALNVFLVDFPILAIYFYVIFQTLPKIQKKNVQQNYR